MVDPDGTPDNVMEPLVVTEQGLVASFAVRKVPAVPVILMVPARLSKSVTGAADAAPSVNRRRSPTAAKFNATRKERRSDFFIKA